MDFEWSEESSLAFESPYSGGYRGRGCGVAYLRTRTHTKNFTLEGLGDLTACVELRHQGVKEGDSVVAFLRLTFFASETCRSLPKLTLHLKVQKFGERINGRRVPIATWFEMKNRLGIKMFGDGQNNGWINYRGNEYNFEDNRTVSSEGKNEFEYLLQLNFHVANVVNVPKVSKPSEPTKQLDSPTLQQFFTDSKIRDETSDFKIICEGEELKCHKFILGLRSDFFKTMFNGDYKEANQGFLNIEEFKIKTMKSFHKYLYSDSIDQCEVDVDLLRAAHMYDFKRLVGECEYELSLKINEENVKEMFDVARTLELPTLFNQAKQKIQEMMNEWGQNETITRMNQIKQVFGSLKLGGSGNVSMDGFDEILKNKLNEYFESKE